MVQHHETTIWEYFVFFSTTLTNLSTKWNVSQNFALNLAQWENRQIDESTFHQPPSEVNPPKAPATWWSLTLQSLRETAELQLRLLEEIRLISSSMISTLPETKTASENWELENYFPLAFAPIFRGKLLVLGSATTRLTGFSLNTHRHFHPPSDLLEAVARFFGLFMEVPSSGSGFVGSYLRRFFN